MPTPVVAKVLSRPDVREATARSQITVESRHDYNNGGPAGSRGGISPSATSYDCGGGPSHPRASRIPVQV